MTTPRGFGLVAALIVIAGILVIGGGAYVALTPDKANAPEADSGSNQNDASISWNLTSVGERDYIPYTKVAVVIDGTTYDVGEFQGSCSELGASGGVDGTGLVAGELSAVQCWFAGGGDEIGVFAHEDGGYQIMVGTLEEPIEGSAGFRGDFTIRTDILP
jgi:hypothetical protein